MEGLGPGPGPGPAHFWVGALAVGQAGGQAGGNSSSRAWAWAGPPLCRNAVAGPAVGGQTGGSDGGSWAWAWAGPPPGGSSSGGAKAWASPLLGAAAEEEAGAGLVHWQGRPGKELAGSAAASKREREWWVGLEVRCICGRRSLGRGASAAPPLGPTMIHHAPPVEKSWIHPCATLMLMPVQFKRFLFSHVSSVLTKQMLNQYACMGYICFSILQVHFCSVFISEPCFGFTL